MFDREYYFYGKHADMVKKLTAKWNDEIGASVFERNLDVYEVAPIIGWIYNRKAEVERDENNKTRVFRDKMLDDRPQLLFNYRNLMLLNGEKWIPKSGWILPFIWMIKTKSEKLMMNYTIPMCLSV